MWEKLFTNALGQWRFENNLPEWEGPCFMTEPKKSTLTPVKLKEPQVFSSNGTPVRSIVYSGAGKDGLLSMKRLERAIQSFTPPTHIQSVTMVRQVSKPSVLKK